MKKEIDFTKMQGLGNDFVVVRADQLAGIDNLSDFAKKVCDRRFGVGGDGLGIVDSVGGERDDADASFRIFNSDGSEAMMCGNGIRGAAIFARDIGIVPKKKGRFSFKTKSGIKIVTMVGGNNVRVDMGEPVIGEGLVVNGRRGLNVSMGNPHFVIVAENIYDLDLEKMGPMFENAPVFPDRTNTEFIHIMDAKNIDMRVWERGAGETLACGTGASAAAVAAAAQNLAGRSATVHMKGGNLDIDWNKSDNRVYMTGPAETSFVGKFFFSRQR